MKLHRIITCVLVLFLTAGCSAHGLSAAQIEAINAEETYTNGPYSLSAYYTSMDSLYEKADLVVAGTALDSASTLLDGFPQTTAQFEVSQVLAGEFEAGSVVAVTEEGGYLDGQLVYLGVPPMEIGQEYLLFLTSQDELGRRFIVGAFQGRFILREGYYFQQSTQEAKLSVDEYSPSLAAEFPVPAE